MRRLLAILLVSLPLFAADPNCGARSAKLLILGTYHMDNPGLDAVNIEADDVTSARRQAELADLAGKLARFRPTKIAVEGARAESEMWNTRYANYLKGEHTLSRNEIEQVGFRLAKTLGHAAIYPIDFKMMMSGQRYDEIDFSLRKKPAAPADAKPRQLSEAELRLRKLTIVENLRELNDPAKAAKDHTQYLDSLLPEEGKVALYDGADLLTNWYKRNFRMFANLARITDFEQDRVLLIVGSGHLQILSDLANDAPYFCLEETAKYLQ